MAEWNGESFNLIFDADDTLWESNIHFLEAERAFAAAAVAAGAQAQPAEIVALVRRSELEIIKRHGYGRRPYVLALHRATELLFEREESRELMRAEVEHVAHQLIHRRCELLPGVEPTLSELAGRHTLLLFTKGQRDEQIEKLEHSGLAPLFSRVEIPAEKDVDAYLELVARAKLDRRRTFMIGNSPRSDINPALRAGLRAVYIPHPHTWVLEHEALTNDDDRVIILNSFPRLLEVF